MDETRIITKTASEGMILTDGIVFVKEVQTTANYRGYLNDIWREVNLSNPKVSDTDALNELLEVLK